MGRLGGNATDQANHNRGFDGCAKLTTTTFEVPCTENRLISPLNKRSSGDGIRLFLYHRAHSRKEDVDGVLYSG